jgi:hypothetical protein
MMKAMTSTLILTSVLGGAVESQAQTVILHVVDRGAMDAPIGGVEVRAQDSTGKPLHEGITDGNGDIVFKAPLGQTVTIRYQKLGYIRRPETTTTTARAGNTRVVGPLIRTAADKDYYARVGVQIDAITKAAAPSERERVAKEEIDRIGALPQDAQAIVAANTSPETGHLPTSELATGELKSVDSAKRTLTLSSGEIFLYNEQTKVTGAQRGVAGLASTSGPEVTIQYITKGADRIAIAVEVAGGGK